MIGACIFMTANDVDWLTHTKQLLNLLCIDDDILIIFSSGLALSLEPSPLFHHISFDCFAVMIHYIRLKHPHELNKLCVWNRYNQITHLTQDTIWKSDKNTRKHHIRDSQEASPFPAGDQKATRNSMTDKHETQITKRIDKFDFSPPLPSMISAVVRYKAVDTLFIVASIVLWGLCPCFIVQYLVSFLFLQSSRWGRKNFLLYFNYLWTLEPPNNLVRNREPTLLENSRLGFIEN